MDDTVFASQKPRDAQELATKLLTTGDRSLWAELEGRETQPDERRRCLINPFAVADTRCEALLLGCLLVYGRYPMQRVCGLGLQPRHFTRLEYRRLYERLLAVPVGQDWNLALLAKDVRTTKRLVALMDDYLDTAAVVGEAMAHTEHVDAAEAAYALAERLVRLAAVRDKLRDANALMSGHESLMTNDDTVFAVAKTHDGAAHVSKGIAWRGGVPV